MLASRGTAAAAAVTPLHGQEPALAAVAHLGTRSSKAPTLTLRSRGRAPFGWGTLRMRLSIISCPGQSRGGFRSSTEVGVGERVWRGGWRGYEGSMRGVRDLMARLHLQHRESGRERETERDARSLSLPLSGNSLPGTSLATQQLIPDTNHPSFYFCPSSLFSL